MTDVPRDERRPYFACPACGTIGEPDSIDYRLTSDREHADWTWPVTVACGSCRTRSEITHADVLDRDGRHTCSRCGHHTPCPGQADRVICWGCGLNELGPAAMA